MKILSNCIGLMAVLCVIDGANAALRTTTTNSTGRERVSLAVNPTTAAMRRLPTMKSPATVAASSPSSSSDSSLMDTNECVDAYTECIKATDVCGFDFEECTTHELFYAKKPQCNNVLLQCSTAGINTLFGTTSITNLTADNMEVYPTQGSILGQFIEAGAINNRLDKSSCVKRYASCLKKESVCGEDFELCTSDNEFKKQKIYCESTLARCTDDGKTELFGQTNTDMAPKADSRLRIMITEGADLASVNAVSTCYKVADQCILSACSANPYKCIVDSSLDVVNITQAIKDGLTLSSEQASSLSEMLTSANVNSYIRGACKDTIGGNKYCHMTANEGEVPTASKLIDENERDEVYSDIYASRMNAVMRGKIQEFANDFDKQTKDKCVETIMACAMRSCGSGLGSACYKKVFGANRDMGQSIAGDSTYTEIQTGCEAIVNTDTNCQYAAAVSKSDSTYAYTYNDRSAFTTLFPKSSTKSDPLGAVERLNAALSENYNDAAIAELKKKCRNTAVSCIRSLCGTDFTNCYRNRTDVMTDTYNTAGNGLSTPLTETSYSNVVDPSSKTVTLKANTTTYDSSAFDKSMNKVGGVLDFTIVRGLCINTVKESSACDEHLKLEAYSLDAGEESVWGGQNVRDAWVDAVKTGYSANVTRDAEAVLAGCRTSSTDNSLCDPNYVTECDTVDTNGCIYDVEVYESRNEYQLNMAANTLFQEVLGDLELEAQAKYNAKLTREQNMCMAANNGGIMGRKDIASTYMWVKLRSNRVPKNYSVNGLKSNEFVASNDLYGSFCRARVTVQSDDPDLQRYLQENSNSKNWSTAYFAVGDVFTCGSWIPQKDLESISTLVACKKAKADGKIDRNVDCSSGDVANKVGLTTGQKWLTAAAGIGAAGIGGVGMDLLQSKTGLGGLINTDKKNNANKNALRNELDYAKSLKTSACPASNDGQGVTSTARDQNIDGLNFEKYTANTSGSSNEGCVDLNAYITRLEKNLGDVDTEWTAGRRAWDIGAAVVTGGIGAWATGSSIKASNIQKFTADQQEFMNNVGNHIYCFIGADEAGTYGDLIEISID